MAQGQRGIIYVANKSGVLEFDGRNWSLIPTPGPIYTVSTVGAEVFVAGYNGFGKLAWGNDNLKSYQSLSDGLPGASRIFSSVAVNDNVYFLSEQQLTLAFGRIRKDDAIKADVCTGGIHRLVRNSGHSLCQYREARTFKMIRVNL